MHQRKERGTANQADMTTDNPAEAIQPQQWSIEDPGAKVIDADSDQIGTVCEMMPSYLEIKVQENLLTDAEMYVLRPIVVRVAADVVLPRHTKDELQKVNLESPPAAR